MFIGIAILGCLINRKTNKVKVTKSNVFKPAAWVALILLGISMLYLLVSVFTDVGLSSNYYISHHNDVDPDTKYPFDSLLSTILSAVMFVLYIGVIFVPSYITEKRFAYKR
jgi:hypothetical protein